MLSASGCLLSSEALAPPAGSSAWQRSFQRQNFFLCANNSVWRQNPCYGVWWPSSRARALQEATRAAEIEERERRTQALVKAELGSKRRATVAGWGLARGMAAQNASTARMAQLTDAFSAVFGATGAPAPIGHHGHPGYRNSQLDGLLFL